MPKPGEAEKNAPGYCWDIRYNAGEDDPQRAAFVEELKRKYRMKAQTEEQTED